MKNTDQLANALKLLREADSECAAPEFLETRLRAAFREQQAKRRRPILLMWGWAAGITAVAAAVVIGAFVWRPASVNAPPPAVVAVERKAPEVAPAVAPEPEKTVAVAARPRLTAPRALAPVPRRQAEPTPVSLASAGETSQDFFAIPYAPPLTERGEVIRVRLPRQSIRSLGIPVNAERMFERVPADLLVGDDGIPRGVRLVRASEFQ